MILVHGPEEEHFMQWQKLTQIALPFMEESARQED